MSTIFRKRQKYIDKLIMTTMGSKTGKYSILVCSLISIFAFKSLDNEIKANSNCNCKKVVEAYTVLNNRFKNNDTLIGPKKEWNDGTFEENEYVDVLKKETALDISYTPIKRAIKGYYIIKKTHLIHCENWLAKNCPKAWKNVEKNKPKYVNKKYIE